MRRREAERLNELFVSAAAGGGGALVLHGEAGIGKTALIEDALAATSLRPLRAAGAEFEMELPFATLHQLFARVLDHRAQLPTPQAAALETVFGLRENRAPDPFLVGLAVLGMLAELAPVACVVEDAQWVDAASLQAFTFAARRVEVESVAFVFSLREPGAIAQLAGLPQLPVTPLDDAEARALLATEVQAPLDEAVRDRIVAEAHGNPLALLELPRRAGRVALAGGFSVPSSSSVTAVERSFAERISALPEPTRALVVLAAAEPLGDPELLRRAAEVAHGDAESRRRAAATTRRGAEPRQDATAADVLDALYAAEAEGLITLGASIRFRHPLARSAAYRTASPATLRAAHAALADATDARLDPDRRAWHRAQAAVGADEDVAADLEQSAGRALLRGGLAAASAFLERAAVLSADPARRASRTVAAAEARFQAGAPDAALELLDRAQAGPRGDGDAASGRAPAQARAELLRALIGFHRRRDAAATTALLEAAHGLEPDLARETYVLAFASAMYIDHAPGRVRALAEQLKRRAPRRTPPRPVDRLLDALLDQMSLDDAAAVPAMRAAVQAFRDDSSGDPRWLDLAGNLATDLHDEQALRELAERQVHLARRRGDLAVLPDALNMQTLTRVVDGRLRDAELTEVEVRAIEAATGAVGMAFGAVVLAAWRGDRRSVEATFQSDGMRDDPNSELYARAVLCNGLGRYDEALEVTLRADELQRGAYVGWQVAHELVEAAARAGKPDVAAETLDRIIARARASGTHWAIGAALRSQALLADDTDAGALYVEAIDRLGRTGAKGTLARAQLVYGEWLRRRRRRAEARTQLRAAHETFDAIGAELFAARAKGELEATGEHPRRRNVALIDTLTPQELHIARHVAAGATTKEVAAELFLSPRTIDAHLRSIFRKLDITSRRQLRDLEVR